MASFSGRVELKAHLEVQRGPELARLPFPARLLVASTPHRQTDDPRAIEILASRLNANRGEYYCLVVYYEASYSHREIGFVAHESLEYLHRHSTGNKWRVPFMLCQSEAAILAPTAFCVYQHDQFSLPAHFTGRKMALAFEMRMKLYKWLQTGSVFQDAHPLSDLEARYVGISETEKVFDTACYFLLAHAISAEACIEWLDGEELLLRHKLLLRPSLAANVCASLGLPYICLMDTMPHLRQCHQANLHRVRDNGIFASPDDRFTGMAASFVAELLRMRDLKAEDAATSEQRAELFESAPTPPTLKMPLRFADIQACAPQCMQRLLAQALGTTAQQKSMKPLHRDRLSQYLVECGVSGVEIAQATRPRLMIAYEMEEQVEQTWPEILESIQRVETDRDDAIELTGVQYQTCFDIMRAELCPHKRPRAPGFFAMTPQQQKARAKNNFVAAKQKCHANMLELFDARKKAGKTHRAAENVKRAWAMSPWCFTQTAAKGEKANIDKPAADENKKRQRSEADTK